MKKSRVVVIVSISVVVLSAGFAVWWWVGHNDFSGGPQTIEGRVTATNDGCFADGACSITLDNSKVIITGCGLMANGKTCKSYDQSKLHGGQQIKATVIKDKSGTYNLECDSCTIRVIE